MKRLNRGFTLMEMLIVVTIIGILSAIIIPRLFTSTAKAKESALEAERQTINSQIELFYFIEGVYPDGSSSGSGAAPINKAGNWEYCADGQSTTCITKYWPETIPSSDPKGVLWQWCQNTYRVPKGNDQSNCAE